PRHERIVFIAQTERGRELVGYAIAIANKQAVLPFPGRCLDELFALTHADSVSSTSTQLAGKAELELCKSIELVRGSASIQGCDAATKIELASRARAQLGLPVVKMVMDNVDSGADLMRSEEHTSELQSR